MVTKCIVILEIQIQMEIQWMGKADLRKYNDGSGKGDGFNH